MTINQTGDLQTASNAGGAAVQSTPVTPTQSGAYLSASVQIASGNSTSAPIAMKSGPRLAGVQIPAAFTGTSISFSVSADNVTYGPFKQAGTTVSITVAASDAVDILGAYPGLTAWPYVEIVSSATEAAARTINYVTV
jgi:hypothetical protein